MSGVRAGAGSADPARRRAAATGWWWRPAASSAPRRRCRRCRRPPGNASSANRAGTAWRNYSASITGLTEVHTRRAARSYAANREDLAVFMTRNQAETNAVHRLVRINYAIRTGAFAWCFFVVGLHGWQSAAWAALFWVLLPLQFLVYPHLAYLRARLSTRPKAAELSNLQIDAAAARRLARGARLSRPGSPTRRCTPRRSTRWCCAACRARSSRLGLLCLGAALWAAGRRVPLLAGDQRPGHRAVLLRLARLRLRRRLRRVRAEPAPGGGARGAARAARSATA